MGQLFSQPFPPSPELTEKNLPDQSGKVFIVTGGTSGVGKSLSGILYGANATVYLTGRSREKGSSAISDIKSTHPGAGGRLEYLHLDLTDLAAVKLSAETFMKKEKEIHVLFNNAGIMFPPKDSRTVQGHELQLGVNAIAPFLFTKLLTPMLAATAKKTMPGDVRVVWLSSSFAGYFAPSGGVDMGNLDYQHERHHWIKYATSKAANTLYSAEMARRFGKDGIISVSMDPGNLRSGLRQNVGFLFRTAMKLLEYDPIYGAYTELFGGFSPRITLDGNNAWVCPWGSIGRLRTDIESACRSRDEGGTNIAYDFWEWTSNQVEQYCIKEDPSTGDAV